MCVVRKIFHCLLCKYGPKPPKGDPPTASQKSFIESHFPNLQTWSVTGPATPYGTPGRYNCIAWSVGITDEWLWPGDTVADFDAFYALYGWTVSETCNREYQRRKIALYAYNSDPNDCKHGSRETHNCGWHESKLGSHERIMHVRNELEGGSYGNIIRCYEKHHRNANLDLC